MFDLATLTSLIRKIKQNYELDFSGVVMATSSLQRIDTTIIRLRILWFTLVLSTWSLCYIFLENYGNPLGILNHLELIVGFVLSLIPVCILASIFEDTFLALGTGMVILDEHYIQVSKFSTKPLQQSEYKELLMICQGDISVKCYVKKVRESGRELVDGEFQLLRMWYGNANGRKSYADFVAFVEDKEQASTP